MEEGEVVFGVKGRSKLCTLLRAFSGASMVLSWRADCNSATKSQSVFTAEDNVKMFFYYFEIRAMRGKEDALKASELLAHLNGETYVSFFDKFTVEGAISESETNFREAENAISDYFVEKKGL